MDKLILADIGAANFKLHERWLYLQNDVELVLFEPDERSFKELKKKGLSAYNMALGESEKIESLNLTRKAECSSFYEPNREYLDRFPNNERWDILEKVDIEVKPLDYLNLHIDFIKIDTQGTELEILKGARNTLGKVLGLELEVSFLSIYKNQPLFGDISNYLSKVGFEFFEFVTEYRYGRQELNRKGQLSFADALFLRTPEFVKGFNQASKVKYESICKAYNKEDLAIEVSKQSNK